MKKIINFFISISQKISEYKLSKYQRKIEIENNFYNLIFKNLDNFNKFKKIFIFLGLFIYSVILTTTFFKIIDLFSLFVDKYIAIGVAIGLDLLALYFSIVSIIYFSKYAKISSIITSFLLQMIILISFSTLSSDLNIFMKNIFSLSIENDILTVKNLIAFIISLYIPITSLFLGKTIGEIIISQFSEKENEKNKKINDNNNDDNNNIEKSDKFNKDNNNKSSNFSDILNLNDENEKRNEKIENNDKNNIFQSNISNNSNFNNLITKKSNIKDSFEKNIKLFSNENEKINKNISLSENEKEHLKKYKYKFENNIFKLEKNIENIKENRNKENKNISFSQISSDIDNHKINYNEKNFSEYIIDSSISNLSNKNKINKSKNLNDISFSEDIYNFYEKKFSNKKFS